MSFPNVVDVNAQSESTEQGKGKEVGDFIIKVWEGELGL